MISDRVLVTGAAGFVGRHLCQLLANQGGLVRSAVRGSSPSTLPGGEVVSGCDLGAAGQWTAALEGVDCVVHCAARVHVMKDTAGDPLAAFRKTNVEGTLRLARAAARQGVRRFVFLSSVKVMGESSSGRQPFTEVDEPAPEDPYGISKWEAEQALVRLAADTGLELVIVRCPLVYGPGVKGNFRNLIRLADSPWPLPLGGIENARSMVFVGNLVDFLVHVSKAEAAAGQIFFVSDGDNLSTSDLVKLLRTGLGRSPRLFSVPWLWIAGLARKIGKEALVCRLAGSLQVDITKARELLDWAPPYTVRQGIAATLKDDRTSC